VPTIDTATGRTTMTTTITPTIMVTTTATVVATTDLPIALAMVVEGLD
jgi:hypothetical protein